MPGRAGALAPAGHRRRPVREDQRRSWLRILRAEHARRIDEGQARDYREELIVKLDLMEQRMQASPHWRPLTAEESRESAKSLNSWFAAHGYAFRLDEEE
jgi:hypothetical protein